MERLTRRFEEDGVKAVWCRKINDTFLEGEKGYEEADKLAEYEDAEEQGMLVRLPCKIGTIVYEIYQFLSEGAWEIAVHRIELEDLEKIGKTVFLTREEAETALERMGRRY